MIQRLSVNGKEYDVVRLLGHGKGGYSYLVSEGKQEYVLKQIHHEPCDYYQFGNKLEAERQDYRKLCETGIPIPQMYQIDEQEERILKEYIKGPSVYELVLKDRMKGEYLSRIREMCGRFYPLGLNIDYFPTNFIVQGEKLYYVDYEVNAYMEEWNFENWGIKYWSKTPEFLKYVEADCRNI